MSKRGRKGSGFVRGAPSAPGTSMDAQFRAGRAALRRAEREKARHVAPEPVQERSSANEGSEPPLSDSNSEG